jgi:DNA-binding HxlR family transcriptional regulator
VFVKRYGQYCPVAHALDQIGDRWALLIVRELMLGQRRFTDLSEALPGIGSNILTSRLRGLETAGIVAKKKLQPPWAVTVYELTEHGRGLHTVLRSLAEWGAETLGPPAPEDCWSMYAVHARFRPEAAVDGVYEIRFEEGETITLEVRDGELTAAKLPAAEPTLSVELAPQTLHAMTEGMLGVEAAVAEGRARVVVGSSKELAQLIAMFARSAAQAAAAAA